MALAGSFKYLVITDNQGVNQPCNQDFLFRSGFPVQRIGSAILYF